MNWKVGCRVLHASIQRKTFMHISGKTPEQKHEKKYLKKFFLVIVTFIVIAFLVLYGQFIWYCNTKGSFDAMLGYITTSDRLSSTICMHMLKKKYLDQDEVNRLNHDAGIARVIFIDDRYLRENILRLMLSRGVRIDSVSDRVGSKATALHTAASSGDVDAVNLLLKYGARKDAKDIYGRTPADVAHNEYVKFPDIERYKIIENILSVH